MSFSTESEKKHLNPVVEVTYPSSYSDISFWWRCESSTLTTLDKTKGASYVNSASLVTAARKIGTYGLRAGPGVGRAYITSANIINPSKGRFGAWFQWYSGSADYLFNLLGPSSANCLRFGINGSGYLFSVTINASPSTLTASEVIPNTTGKYFVEFAWNSTRGYRHMYINGRLVAESNCTPWSAATASTLYFGGV
jgi:hypothetical protein